MTLRDLREARGLTQAGLAKAAGMHQPEVSRAETREDHVLSTLRRYIAGLGGELEVAARFGEKRIRLKGV